MCPVILLPVLISLELIEQFLVDNLILEPRYYSAWIELCRELTLLC